MLEGERLGYFPFGIWGCLHIVGIACESGFTPGYSSVWD